MSGFPYEPVGDAARRDVAIRIDEDCDITLRVRTRHKRGANNKQLESPPWQPEEAGLQF